MKTIRRTIQIPIIAVFFTVLSMISLYAYHEQHTAVYSLMDSVVHSNLQKLVGTVEESSQGIERLRDSLNVNYLRIAQCVSALIAADTSLLRPENMQQLAEEIGVPEIHISDRNGILRWGNIPSFYGYDYASSIQSSAFLPALENPEFALAQAATPRGIDSTLFQYIGVARQDSPGIVQIGVEPRELERLVYNNRLERIAGNARFGQNGFFLVANTDGVLLYHPDANMLGKNLHDYSCFDSVFAPDISNVDSEEDVIQFLVDGEKMYAAFTRHQDYIIIAGIPQREFTASLFVLWRRLLGASIFALLAASFVVFRVSQKSIIAPVKKLNESLHLMAQGNLDCSLSEKRVDEFGEMARNFNAVVASLRAFMQKVREMIFVLSQSAMGLSSSAQQGASTASQQSSAVKEIVSTMEDSGNLSRSIEGKMKELQALAMDTQQKVQTGFEKIQTNLSMMEEIDVANGNTLKGIEFLAERVKNIWEIVNMINAIADQTKIIAFNAELEASASGETGENFQIVATEIRRLADSTVAATTAIKDRIGEIQKSSDQLLTSSRNATEKIGRGSELVQSLENLFLEILAGADVSSESSHENASSISRQVTTFDHILLAIKQISDGVDQIAESTEQTSATAEQLDEVVDTLREMLEKYKD